MRESDEKLYFGKKQTGRTFYRPGSPEAVRPLPQF